MEVPAYCNILGLLNENVTWYVLLEEMGRLL